MSEKVWIEGGTFLMGSNEHYPDEGPVQKVSVDGFWIDPTPVTNKDWAEFVGATGYTTIAEIAPKAEDYPGAIPELLVPGSMVFTMTPGPVNLKGPLVWWEWLPGADWRHPVGPDSNLNGLDDHPVVHVAYDDVMAYCDWAGKRLPTEAEWEYAARGGLEGATFTWGDEDPQESEHPKANTWQGQFPYNNTELDGWTRTAPVGSYEPNGYGLYDMAGNVWEWTADWYSTRRPVQDGPSCCGPKPRQEDSYDPNQPEFDIPRKVLKGGSFLCTIQYCFRYRPAARHAQMVDSAASHIGFRCVSTE